jgi:hypothetical protein
MRYQCPSCGRTGAVRVPDHFPRDKKARIRCAGCDHRFALTPGRLWPQDDAAAYRALAAAPAAGELLGRLRVDIRGRARETHPLLVLPPHPALPPVLLPDLLGFMSEYTRVCYLGFPGEDDGETGGPDSPGGGDDLERLLAALDLLKVRLHAERFHVFAQSAGTDLALRLAAARPGTVASLILLEPELDCRPDRATLRRLFQAPPQMSREEKETLLLALFRERWRSHLTESHLRGLATLLAPGFSPTRLQESFRRLRPLRYRALARLKPPALIVLSRDGRRECRDNGLYLQAALPDAELLELDRGGAWAAWLSTASFPHRLPAFLRAKGRAAAPARKHRATPAGQSVGWMLALFAALTLGLSFLPAYFSFQPDYMGAVLPPLLGGLLPLLWYLAPKKPGLLRFLRFQGFGWRSLLPALLAGLLLGLSSDALGSVLALDRLPGLTADLPSAPLPARLAGLLPRLGWPIWLSSPLPGTPGRAPLLAALLVLSVPVFGYFQSLLTLRRSRWRLLLPVLLFAFIPPAWPDLLWRLPCALAAALLFARSLSLASPFFLLAGFALASELPRALGYGPVTSAALARLRLPELPLDPALAAAGLLLLLSLAAALLWGRRQEGYSPETLYFTRTRLADPGTALRWHAVPGAVILLFSALAAVVLVFGFLQI